MAAKEQLPHPTSRHQLAVRQHLLKAVPKKELTIGAQTLDPIHTQTRTKLHSYRTGL